MKKVFYILLSLFLPFQSSFAQISGIINSYTKVIDVDLACNHITVTSAAEFDPGDTVLIIQMQGGL